MTAHERRQAIADPSSISLDQIDVSDAELFSTDTLWGYFERLRNEDPVHYCAESDSGPYWSVTRYEDIVQVEKNPDVFSSEPTIFLKHPGENSQFVNGGFITMDGPRHLAVRSVVQPVASPRNLKNMEPLIRERAIEILDRLPVGETFDWVDRVSIELTTSMLATMFDFPWDERRRLPRLSDIATASPDQLAEMGLSDADREKEIMEGIPIFAQLLNERQGSEHHNLDFMTALANADATKELDPVTLVGTIGLLIVGGNDTTRNSISGSVVALNEYPAEYDKLRDNPSLIPTMVDEIIRWQTPLAYMRRTATRDTELRGKRITKGDKVVMWYVSGNRDETAIDRANEFLIDRKDSKRHLSFGLGKHFCMGSRMAEMQLRVVWEETVKRFRFVEVAGEPVRVRSSFIRGFTELPVRLHSWG